MKWSLLTFLFTKKAHLHMHTLKYTFYEDFCNVSKLLKSYSWKASK